MLLSDFARTPGAKDKKKRKRRGLGKKLLMGAGIGIAGLGSLHYGKAALRGAKLGAKQVAKYGIPKKGKHIRRATVEGLREQIGQDKALLQELAEKIKNRKADPLADVDSRNKIQRYIQRKWEELVPDEEVRKPLEIADKIAKGYTRGAYDVGRMVERGSNIRRTVIRKGRKIKKYIQKKIK